MVSAESYVPGALSDFLTGKGSDTATFSGKRKRKKHVNSCENAEKAVLFKKRITDSRHVELPVGEKKLQPKLVRFDETDNLTSESSSQGTSTGQSRMKKKMKKVMTTEEKARTVFVGNAPLTSTGKEIKKLFSKFGAIESVRLRSVIAADEKTSKKVAALKRNFSNKMKSLTFYVKFKDAKSVENALELNGEKLGENLLRVDSCCGQRRYSCQTTVFVGNLPFDVSENELAAHFETSGNVSFVRIVRDSKTGNGKGIAFVAFKDSTAVPLALQLDGSTFRQRQLRVTRVQKKKKKTASNPTNQKRVSRSGFTQHHSRRTQFGRPGGGTKKKVRKVGKRRRVKNSVMT